MYATIILCVVLVMVLMAGFSRMATRMFATSSTYKPRTAGPVLEEVVREDNGARHKVAVISLDGIIHSGSMEAGSYSLVEVIRAQLNEAADDQRVKAVVLRVDSPGGEVLASDEISRAIREFQRQTGKPVVASMGNVAASGGYYVSAPCRWIVANELTITGSIGVIMSTWNYRNLMDKVGVVPQTYKSGKFKDMLSGQRELKDIPQEERAMIQSLIDETYSKFKRVVEEGREEAFDSNQKLKQKGRQLSPDWTDYADGRVLSGTEAFRYGFVDELGNFEDAVTRAQGLAGITQADLIEYRPRYDWSDFFRVFGKSEPKQIKVDLGFDTPRLQAGRLYFLSPIFAP
jgi:protease-4